MLLDKENMFSEEQAITTTCYSTDYVKFGPNDVSFMPVIVQVVEDFAGLTSLTVEFETSAQANFSTSTTLCSSTILGSKLKTGLKYPITYLPKGNLGYMRIKYTVIGTATAGKITAGVVNCNEISWHNM